MAVDDSSYVDAIAIDHDGKTLIMMISDHLDWEADFEFDHLTILQEKLNTYLWFIESKQYQEVYPGIEFESFLIDIRFLHNMSENCMKYIDVANRKLSLENIIIVPKFVSEATEIHHKKDDWKKLQVLMT